MAGNLKTTYCIKCSLCQLAQQYTFQQQHTRTISMLNQIDEKKIVEN